MTENNAKRPDRLSMEGMIWNANHVLEQALDPKQKGIPQELFAKCKGVCLLSVVEAGFIFSGNVGTGILLKKKADGTWSPPCAMGMAGVGWGLLFGGAVKDIMTFIFDDNSMEGMCAENGLRLGGQLNLTVGPVGRNYEGGIGIGNNVQAVGTCSVAFSKGVFIGASIEGAVVGARGGVNDTFYDKVTTPKSVVDGDVTMPTGRPTIINDVYEKLNQLAAGSVPAQVEEEEKEAS